jgi:hypothetical protein
MTMTMTTIEETKDQFKEKYLKVLREKQLLTIELEKYNENTIIQSMNCMKLKYNYLKANSVDKTIFNEIFSRYKNIKNKHLSIKKLINILYKDSLLSTITVTEMKVFLNIIVKFTEDICFDYISSDQHDSDLENSSDTDSYTNSDNESL